MKLSNYKIVFKSFLFLGISLLIAHSSFAQNNFVTDSLKVFGECTQCKNRIEKALKIKGISSAVWNVRSEILTVSFNPAIISLDDIHSKMAAVGHDTELKKAPDAVYNNLPDCCLYRNSDKENHFDDEPIDLDKYVSGVILSEDNKGNFTPLVGANVIWEGGAKGAISNEHGVFLIAKNPKAHHLVISYTGFQTDTLHVEDGKQMQVILAANGQLKSITIQGKSRTTYIDALGPFRTMMINSKDLLKAACCSLSESFETNPSVDAVYNDAITGSKQIQLLGLAGNYSQLLVENIPGLTGIATPLGLNSIAGPWIDNIQLIKGVGSVVNGSGGIAGQINVELKKPENSDKLYLNGYVNDMGRTDLNVNWSQRINERWSTGLLLHDDFLHNKVDFNKDGFRDLPTGNLFSGINRWHYADNKGWMVQFGVKILLDDRTGGETSFQSSDKMSTTVYGLGIKTNRVEGFAKIGYIFPDKKYKSIGLQLSAFNHKQDSYFGLTQYDATQNNFYGNLIYQNIIGNSAHKFRAGLSLASDKYNELFKTQIFKRNEIVSGGFFEYTYSADDKFTAVLGLRGDYNNLYGFFATPRLNVRYEPIKGTTIRLSVGRGQQTANIFAENMGALVSARNVQITTSSTKGAYGLKPEVAWNKGISVDQKFKLFSRDAMLSVDYFRNDFTDQVVVDLEDVRAIKFYNLNGKSFSNSFQSELNFIPVKDLDIRLAYRWFEVKTTYGNDLLMKPFTATGRAFANFGYAIKGWKFDYTFNYIGEKRIPSTAGNPMMYQMPQKSPAYVTMNAQISKTVGKFKNLDFYIGGENLTNYFQKNVIIAADQPFGNFFDASMIWGPVSGRLLYAGFRFKITQ